MATETIQPPGERWDFPEKMEVTEKAEVMEKQEVTEKADVSEKQEGMEKQDGSEKQEGTEKQDARRGPVRRGRRSYLREVVRRGKPRYLRELENELHNSKNINVYINGEHLQTPHLIHIPAHKLDSMEHVLDCISERISFGAGYPVCLYDMHGRKINSPSELENHGRFVVASNLDKHFHDVPYLPVEKPMFRSI